MNDDPIALLERELVEAARRQAGSRRLSQAARHGRIVGGVTTAAVLAVALIVAAGALILLGGHHRVQGPAGAASDRQRLIDIIGALRRPQTSVDLHSPTIAPLLSVHHGGLEVGWGAPDLRLIRRAGLTPWGQGVFLIPVKPTSRRGQEGLAWATGGFIDCCATAADMEDFGLVNNVGRSGGRGNANDRFLALVPDGVAKVQLGRLAMTVHDNVGAAQANGDLVGATPVMFWFGPGGEVIRRIGDLAGSYRSFAISPPGPETAASRAAERDPSTPNPVWITPRVGGPHTAFSVHFRVLLTAAGYTYTITGGSCRSLWGTRGSPDDSRGQIWSDQVVPVAGRQWCPGTYRLSAVVTDLGPAGSLRHATKAFGVATFVVR